jgi:hypothetical protein
MIGEAGREAVLPLDRNTEWMNELADKINSNQTREGAQVVVNLGDREIFSRFVEYTRDRALLSNKNIFGL